MINETDYTNNPLTKEQENIGKIVIYQSEDGNHNIDVQLKDETLWLSLNQIVQLFSRDKSVISRHIKNIVNSGELDLISVVAKNATTASDGKVYVVDYYNLDMIISVGYRINSKQGTLFRKWATSVLKDHLIKGYSINEIKLKKQKEQLHKLQQTILLLQQTVNYQCSEDKQIIDLVKIISAYAYALTILDQYDHESLQLSALSSQKTEVLDYAECLNLIESMKVEFGSELFGHEKDNSFKGIIYGIYQTFDGVELYQSIEEKAGHLLYFIVKDHSFSDGNKRIAAAIFIYFLAKNKVLFKPDGSKRIADNALVAITLMIAESIPSQKDLIVRVVINLINSNN